MNIKFTPTEWAIICHRLESPDYIAESLTDGGGSWTYDQVRQCAGDLYQTDPPEDFGQSIERHGDDLVAAVLKNTLVASTYFGSMLDAVNFGEVSASTMRRHQQKAWDAAEKVGDRFGIDVVPAQE